MSKKWNRIYRRADSPVVNNMIDGNGNQLILKRRKEAMTFMKHEWPLHLMLLPGIVLVAIFCYFPMAGIVMAFQDFNVFQGITGSPWVGLNNYRYLLSLPDTWSILRNTVQIALGKMLFNLVVPIIAALLLNEIKSKVFVRGVQTIVYLPHFVSWVILAGIFVDILSPSKGIVNKMLGALGLNPIYFLGDNRYFQGTMVTTDVWKNFGYGTIIYLAALTGIDPGLYEAAKIEGANRWQQTWHVTLPGMLPIIVLMATLSLGNVLNAGFDQIYNMLSVSVYDTGDILDTFVYRIGMVEQQYSLSTAVSTFKSVVSFVLIGMSYFLADKFAGYKIF